VSERRPVGMGRLIGWPSIIGDGTLPAALSKPFLLKITLICNARRLPSRRNYECVWNDPQLPLSLKSCPVVRRPHVSFRRMQTLRQSLPLPRPSSLSARRCADPSAQRRDDDTKSLSPAADMLPDELWTAMCQLPTLPNEGTLNHDPMRASDATCTGFKNFPFGREIIFTGAPSGLFHLCDTPSRRHVAQHIYLFRSLISFFRIWPDFVPFLVSASMKFLTRQLHRYGSLEFCEI
jgi:hypothetical protein